MTVVEHELEKHKSWNLEAIFAIFGLSRFRRNEDNRSFQNALLYTGEKRLIAIVTEEVIPKFLEKLKLQSRSFSK